MADHELKTDPTAEAGTKRKRPWLRRVGVVVGCFLAGAIINVLVAIGCVHRVNQSEVNLLSITLTDADESLVQAYTSIADPGTMSSKMSRGMGVSVLRMQTADPPPAPYVYIEHCRAGWPFRSMECFFVRERFAPDKPGDQPAISQRVIGGTETLFGSPTYVGHSPYPFRPIAIGFALNLVTYVGAAYLVVFGPLICHRCLQARRRRLEGLCPSCKYDLRGADHGKCPECGEAVTA